jgi:molybdopterin converting factor small subunit
VLIRIRLFARQREIAGAREVAVEVPGGRPLDAWAARRLHPALADGRPYVRFARNGEYAAAETGLEEGDEVACIPPVSGGAGSRSARLPAGSFAGPGAPRPARAGRPLATPPTGLW